MNLEPGMIVLHQDDQKEYHTQQVRLIENTNEPDWAKNRDDVWEFEAVEDGVLFKEGERSYASEDQFVI